MSLVDASPAHVPVLAAIHATCFAGPDRWDAAAMASLLAMPGCFALLHGTNGMLMARSVLDEAEILTLAVHPGRRRRGVARALLAAALDRLAGAAVFLEVAEGNGPARALYAAHGFAPAGRRRGYYAGGADALILRRAG